MRHRMLDESGLRIGGILTDLFGLSGRNLLDGLEAGRDPEQMVAGAVGRRGQSSSTTLTGCTMVRPSSSGVTGRGNAISSSSSALLGW